MKYRKALPVLGAVLLVASVPAHALVVYDPSNYAQNALQAARALQQINQQIQALQNQATMIVAMTRNLDHLDASSLGTITTQLTSLQRLITQGQGVSGSAATIDQQISRLFPTTAATSVGQAAQNAQQRLSVQMTSFQDSLRTQSRILGELANDGATLASVTASSERATGNLAVTQATNQMLALAAKQQAQLQTMLAVHLEAGELADAARLQQRRDAQAAMRRFLGTGQAYTPN